MGFTAISTRRFYRRCHALEADSRGSSGDFLGSVADDAFSENASAFPVGDCTPSEALVVLMATDAAGQDAETSWLLSRAYLQQGAETPATLALKEAGKYRADHPLEWEPAPFLGEARCAKCHQQIFESQQKSRHASTLLRGENLAKFPFPAHAIRDPDDARIVHTFVREKGKIRFQTREGDKVRTRSCCLRVWLARPLCIVRGPRGQPSALHHEAFLLPRWA